MEILVVVAIIVALAGVGVYSWLNVMQSARIDTAKTQCRTLKNAIQMYYLKNNTLPQNINELFNPTQGSFRAIDDPKALIDPWGQSYQMAMGPDNLPMVVSVGSGQQITSSD
jgi:type II secretory pathway pseudopilin PulG